MKQPLDNRLVLPIAIATPFIAGVLGSIPTTKGLKTWYPSLKKPLFTPPGWLIGPVWTLLYLLMGVASWWVWTERKAQPERVDEALTWYGGQLLLNVLWSYLFFGLRLPGVAFLGIIALWGMVWQTMMKFSRVHGEAAWLLAPYLGWLTLVAPFNAMLWWLNRAKK